MTLALTVREKLAYLPLFGWSLAVLLSLSFVKWVYKDARARGFPGIVAALLLIVGCFLPGLLMWLSIRPPLKEKPADEDPRT
jgi:hypothetical protein